MILTDAKIKEQVKTILFFNYLQKKAQTEITKVSELPIHLLDPFDKFFTK
jgi:hypothetical protein